MKTFVITGYSNKTNGFLIVLDAETEAAALISLVDPNRPEAFAVPSRVVDVPDLGTFLACNGETDDEIIQAALNDTLRYVYTIFIAEVVKGKNLDNAVCW